MTDPIQQLTENVVVSIKRDVAKNPRVMRELDKATLRKHLAEARAAQWDAVQTLAKYKRVGFFWFFGLNLTFYAVGFVMGLMSR